MADEDGVEAIDWTERDPFLEKLIQRIRLHLLLWGLVDEIPPRKGYVWGIKNQGDEFSNAPVVAWDKIFAAATSGRLIALDKRTGETVWALRTEAPLKASPSVVGKTIFVGDVAGRLYAVDVLTGQKQLGVGDSWSHITHTSIRIWHAVCNVRGPEFVRLEITLMKSRNPIP